jgi:hypothetical protein
MKAIQPSRRSDDRPSRRFQGSQEPVPGHAPRTDGLRGAVHRLTSLVDLLVFLLLVSVFSFDNLIRKVARDVGLPLQGDVPMLMRVGAFSFLMTLVAILVPSGVVMAAFAVANNDFYTGIKTMPQPADSSEVTVRVTAGVSSVRARSTTSSSSPACRRTASAPAGSSKATISIAARTC